MGALLGVFGPGASTAARHESAMIAAMARRMGDRIERFEAPGVHVVAGRHDWEADTPGWEGPLIAADDRWVVAADAALYYQRDLRRALQALGEIPGAQGTGGLVLAALRAFGSRLGDHLEGDYALLAWERATGRVVLARDHGGRRTIHWTRMAPGTLVVASAAKAVVASPGVSRELDLTTLAAAAAGVICSPRASGFAAVKSVAPGETEVWHGGQPHVTSSWKVPAFRTDWESRIDDNAVERFRDVLGAAVRERMPKAGADRTSVWMSGGWDSTAIFALADEGATRGSVVPISIAYPPGDSGNEDDYVDAVARHRNAQVEWLDSNAVRVFDDGRPVADRDDPMVHPFGAMLRALSRASRRAGARVALDGAGGDHVLLLSTNAVLAQHWRDGRWGHVFHAWRSWRQPLRAFLRLVLLPNISPSTLRWMSQVRGRPIRGYWERPLPSWIMPTAELLDRVAASREPMPGEGPVAFESRFLLEAPLLGRILSWSHQIGLEEGVGTFSPFLDRRVIEFMATRPMSDRGAAPDTKRLLRRAMRGRLPEPVLATRPTKTGTPGDYFRREMRGPGLEIVNSWLGGPKVTRLEEMGVLLPRELEAAVERYRRTSEPAIGNALAQTVEVERWVAEWTGEE